MLVRYLCCLLNEGFDIGRGSCAGRARRFAAAGEHGECGDRADVQPLTEIGEEFGIDLHDEKAAPGPCSDLRQFGRDHPARSAPGCPEIHDDRDRRLRDQAIEIGGLVDVERDRGSLHVVLALTAPGR